MQHMGLVALQHAGSSWIRIVSPALAGGFFPSEPPGKPKVSVSNHPDFYSSQAGRSVLKCFLELHAMLNVRKGSMILENAGLIKVKWASLLQVFSEPL